MINDNLQIQTSQCPNDIFITIDNKKTTYLDFEKKIYSIKSYLETLEFKMNQIKINFENPVSLLASIVACNRLGIVPIIFPNKKYIIKSIDYSSIIKYDFELNDNCIVQDIGSEKEKNIYTYNKNDVQCILFTSGTQNKPKAVELTFGNIYYSAKCWQKIANFSKKDNYLNILPLHHISGLAIFFRSMYYNFQLSFHEYNRNNFASIVKNNDISCISVVPKILMDLIKNGQNDILKLCRIVIVGGSEITKEIYNYLFDNNINAYISYGMTETASGIAGYFVKNSETFKKNYLGSPHSNVDLKIIHDKICIKSPTVMKGYHKGSNCNGSFTSDDSGYIKNNSIYMTSRHKNLIISGGENINLKIIEDVIYQFDKNLNFIVIGIKDKDWGEVSAVLIANQKKQIEHLKKFCINSLPKYMYPKYFIKVNKIPNKKNLNSNLIYKWINESMI